MAKVSVMGTGSWGTALAILLHNNGHEVMLWSAHPEKAASLNQTREDPKKLPGIKIPDGIVITGDEKDSFGFTRYSCICLTICLYACYQQTTFPIDSTGTDYCKCGERCRRKYAYACV